MNCFSAIGSGFLWLLLAIAGCSQQRPITNTFESTDIKAISDFHTRLNQVCLIHALQARYAGPLGYSGREITIGVPVSHLATWVIAPEVASGIPMTLYRLVLSPTQPIQGDFVTVDFPGMRLYATMEIAVPAREVSVQGMDDSDPLALVREVNALGLKAKAD